MITTKKELNYYISQDLSRYGKRKFFIFGWLMGDESFATQIFLRRLRKTEYYYNTYRKRNPFSLFRFYYSFFLYRRMWSSFKLHVPLNVVGPGLYIPHRGGGVYINAKSIGSNFIISSGCVLGSKGTNENIPTIGDNVECCIGAKIIGKVIVGNNSIIAPNSVVIKDVPNNAIVSGVPASIIKIKS